MGTSCRWRSRRGAYDTPYGVDGKAEVYHNPGAVQNGLVPVNGDVESLDVVRNGSHRRWLSRKEKPVIQIGDICDPADPMQRASCPSRKKLEDSQSQWVAHG